MKLIEIIKNNHYVIVGDSEIRARDFVLNKYGDGTLKIDEADEMSITVNNMLNDRFQFKITHSTQPLEMRKVNSLGSEFAFVEIKQIYLHEVQEAIYGYSEHKKAVDYCDKHYNQQDWEEYYNSYRAGFKAHEELVKDSFSLNEIEGALRELSKPQYKFDNKTTFKDLLYMQKKTEWDVEFDQRGKLKLV